MFAHASVLVILGQVLAVTALAVEKRVGTIKTKLCTEVNFGDCQTMVFPTNYQCTPFPTNLQKNVKSLNVEVPGTSDDDCTYFLNTECTGPSYISAYETNLPSEGKGKFASIVAAKCGPS